jgi:tetratricopeptide (TPR) repeat protein
VRALWPAALLLLTIVLPSPACAQAIKGEVGAVIENGFARLVFTLAEDVESQVKVGNGIIIVSYKRPVDVNVDKLAANAPGYVSAARRDPDGKAIRIALARKVTVNSMAAAERLFVDLLPDPWTGLPPGLPREVIDDLAKRARDADRKLRQQRVLARQAKMLPIRVRVASQPTFTRYIFDLPELIGVAAHNDKDRLTLTFDALLKFDLADAKATLPPVIASIDSEIEQEAVQVRFAFGGKVDVRTFREDMTYVVDVTPADAKSPRSETSVRSDELSAFVAHLANRNAPPPAAVAVPPTVPAGASSASEPQRPRPPALPARVAAPSVPPAPEASRASPPAQPELAAPTASAAAKPAADPERAPPAVAPPAADPASASAPVVSPPPAADSAPAAHDGTVDVVVKRQGDGLALSFPFAVPTPAAVFRRADMLWLVFDTDATIGLAALEGDRSRTIRSATLTRRADAAVVRVQLERPRLVSATTDGPAWTIMVGGEVVEPTRPLAISRNIIGPARSSVTIAFDEPRRLHRLDDPEAGDKVMVVTALGPSRGFVKNQDFVEFRALASTHGVVVQPLADDVGAELSAGRIVLTRPAGLTLSATVESAARSANAAYQPHVLDPQSWGFDRQADFAERTSALIRAAAEAPEPKRPIARADLARFYLARELAAEAKAVLDVAIADHPPTAEDPTALVLRAIANIMLRRPEQALKDLANPAVGNQHDAPLWRALAYARQSKWSDAREGFRSVGMAMGTLPIELQRVIIKDMLRASLEVGDVTGALKELHEFETVGVPRELEPTLSVLTGRVVEALGRMEDALRAYQAAADSWDRPIAAQGRLRELLLRRTLGNLARSDAISELETLTTVWRGDETEVEALQLLARLYTEDSRYRDAFRIMRTVLAAHPNSELTQRIHDEAAESFEGLFLAGRGDALPAIDALSLFYDYRELTPIGRRGDEMIRRLADRLVGVDLLDQAAELLQHQVDHRLQGAARSQVAARLAVIYLMNRKADRTLATLRTTRSPDLSNELRNQRLLLEARALSELGRHDLAFEVVSNIQAREAVRLRADILWAAKRWREAAEQIELMYGERWREFEPLGDAERPDILRAAIGFALAEDAIGLERFREKYAGKMGEGPDRRAFEVVTAPVAASGAEFRDVARAIASIDTLDAFLRDLRARYPDTGAAPAGQRRTPGQRPASNQAPKPEPATTGSVAPRSPAGRTVAR